MPRRSVATFFALFVGAMVLYQFSSVYGSYLFIVVFIGFGVHGLNCSLKISVPTGDSVRECAHTLVVRVTANSLPLAVELVVTTDGDIREELLERFSTSDQWTAILRFGLSGWKGSDSIQIEHEIKRLVEAHVERFNAGVAGGEHGSFLIVKVGKPYLDDPSVNYSSGVVPLEFQLPA